MGQGGNVWEFEETEYDIENDSSGSSRGARGGDWEAYSGYLHASTREGINPSLGGGDNVGFRVASVPEPATMAILMLGGIGILRRRKCVRR